MDDEIESVDQISELPEPLIQEILSFLSTKEIMATSILSKKWYHLWASFPFLEFDESQFGVGEDPHMYPNPEEARLKFLNTVNNNLRRFQEHSKFDQAMQTLKLSVSIVDSRVASHVNNWIGLALRNDIHHLEINFTGHVDSVQLYYLPQEVFALCTIKSIKLEGKCKLVGFPTYNVVNCAALTRLQLFEVYLNDQMYFDRIISNCHSLEFLVLRACFGLKKLRLISRHQLKRIDVLATVHNEIEVIQVHDAPKLDIFMFEGNLNCPSPCESIIIDECHKLRIVILLGTSAVDDRWVNNLLSKHPNLQLLVLRMCSMLMRVRFASDSLQYLGVINCELVSELVIDAPRLVEFRYSGDPNILLVPMHISGDRGTAYLTVGLEANIMLDTPWLLALRKLIFQTKYPILGLRVFIVGDDNEITFSLEEISGMSSHSSIVHEIENLEVIVRRSPLNYSALFNGLFWVCHPLAMSLKLEIEEKDDAIKFLQDNLLQVEFPTCCNLSHIKCWRHYLKDFTVENLDGMQSTEINFKLRWWSYSSVSLFSPFRG